MDLLKAEMEFMSGCVVIADLLDAKIITKKEYEKSRKALSERQDHFSRCFKTPTRVDLSGETRRLLVPGEHEKQEEDSSRFKYTIWASKIFCGVCGDNFGHRVLRREGYRDQTWMCRGRSGNKNKGCRCCNDYIYDYQLTLFLIKAAKHLIRKYNSVRTVRDILSLPPERDFKIMTRELSSVNEGDVGIGIREIWVHREREIEFWFLDETNYKFPLEDYSPRAYR